MACRAADFLGPFYCLIDFIRSPGDVQQEAYETNAYNNNIIVFGLSVVIMRILYKSLYVKVLILMINTA